MTKYVAQMLCLVLIGCAATPTTESNERITASLRQKPKPSLDKTYDWGSKPPNANPGRNRD